MSAFRYRVFFLLLVLVALFPVMRLLADWWTYREIYRLSAGVTYRSFDWIEWEEREGNIVVAHVFAGSPAHRAGIQPGDMFYTLAGRQFFRVADLRSAIEGMEPGSVTSLRVIRNGQPLTFSLRLTRYPAMLYPLNAALWSAARWGFAIAAFLHVLALILVIPLVFLSRGARFSLLLILASGSWIWSTLFRMLLITLWGPVVEPSGVYAWVFQVLTAVGVLGWVLFPALLVHQVWSNSELHRLDAWCRFFLYTPVLLLGGLALKNLLGSPLGPFSLEALTAPFLFYAALYIAVAMGIYLFMRDRKGEMPELRWSGGGSLFIFVLSSLAALMVLGLVPLPGIITEAGAGWFVVGLQLISVAPIGLVSYATLIHGHTNRLLSRTFAYLSIGGVFFFGFVGGMALFRQLFFQAQLPFEVLAGVYGVLLLWIIERGYRRLSPRIKAHFLTEREHVRQEISRFVREMPHILRPDELVYRVAEVIGSAFQATSALVLCRYGEKWLVEGYGLYAFSPSRVQPERLVASFQDEESVWTALGVLGDVSLGEAEMFWREQRMALIVPIWREGRIMAFLCLGARRYGHRVFNLDDVELLRALGVQLLLALDRLALIERERELIQETSRAQLVALRAQINPHFLFNALNTLSALILEAPEEADRVITHLAGIFRHVLQMEDRALIPLGEELALVEHYLSIEQVRFGKRLSVSIEVPEAHRSVVIPAFSVQTLVENAVKHGISKCRKGGTVSVRSMLTDGCLFVEVEDTGQGIRLPDGEQPLRKIAGIGLSNVMARLQHLYGRTDLLYFYSEPEKGTRVVLEVPLEEGYLSEKAE